MNKEGNSQECDEVYYLKESSQQTQKLIIGLEQSNIKDPAYDNLKVEIVELQSQSFFKIQTQYYQIVVVNGVGTQWKIRRRYSDFEWLYQALLIGYPGYILAYFPQKSIQSFVVSKLNLEFGTMSKSDSLETRQRELQAFIKNICSHEIIKYSEQVKVFLSQNDNTFKKGKKDIEIQMNQVEISQSTSNGLFSIVERSMAWMTTQTHIDQSSLQEMEEWKDTQKSILIWISQLESTLEIFQKLINLKTQEIDWVGPQTEIDSVEILKAKVMSGKQYNILFLDDLKFKILQNLNQNLKSMKQIEFQLSQRSQIIKIILYLRKNSSNDQRVKKLLRKKQTFEKNLVTEWQKYSKVIKNNLQIIQNNFKELWHNYCQKMNKIWK